MHFGLNSVGTLIATILPSLVRQLHWPPIRVHYILTGIHAAYALYVCHVVPDSLSNEEKHQAQESYRNSQDPEFGFWKSVKKVASLCNPFATFGPTTINTSGNPLRHDLGKNWSLAFLYLGLLLGSIGTVSDFSWRKSLHWTLFIKRRNSRIKSPRVSTNDGAGQSQKYVTCLIHHVGAYVWTSTVIVGLRLLLF